MRKTTFEAIIEVQNKHIERLERMVEQLYAVVSQNQFAGPKIAPVFSEDKETTLRFEEPAEMSYVGTGVNIE